MDLPASPSVSDIDAVIARLHARRLIDLVSGTRCPVHGRAAGGIERQPGPSGTIELLFTPCCDALQWAIQAALGDDPNAGGRATAA